MESQQWIVLISFIMPIALSIIFLWFFTSFQKNKNQLLLESKDAKLREQKLIIENQLALEEERSRIASEMHDDLGGGLTSIKYLGQKMLRDMTNEPDKIQASKIVNHAQDLVSNMSEIIWAMNSGFDTIENFIGYSRRYAHEFCEEHNITLDFKVKNSRLNLNMRGEKRRHLFLIIKEALHNVVKHSEANNIQISIDISDQLELSIKDNGNGFTESQSIQGNGLANMKKRAKILDGVFHKSSLNGTEIRVSIPIISNPQQGI